MRVAYVCADAGVPIFGHKGCSVHVQELVRALLRQGAAVDLIASRVDGTPSPGLESLRVYPLPSVGDGEPPAHTALVAGLNQALVATLQRAGPYDLIYERYSLWSFAGLEQARTAGTPCLLEVNAPLIEEQARHRGLRDGTAAIAAAEQAFPAATALLAVSTEVADWLKRVHSVKRPVHILPNGVDPQRFRPDVPPTESAESFTVGFTGSMKAWHGLDVLIEAFARLHARDAATRLMLIGTGPEAAAVHAGLADRGLEPASRLVGAVSPDAVPGYVTSMDAAVAPYAAYTDFYFSPLKVYEYLAAGRAVVASDVGQLKTLIRHDVNGLLVPPGDPAALAAALERLLREPRLRERLGEAGRASVLHDHTWDAVAAQVLRLAGRATPRARVRARTRT